MHRLKAIRRYRWKYSLGYLPRLFPPKTIKQLAVSKIDYRIHFALNCGAKSCPPIAFYEYDKIDVQLEKAALSFITTETEIDSVAKKVSVSKIFQWYKGDFRSGGGIKKVVSKYLNEDYTGYSLYYKKYDWSAYLKNYDSRR